jgi:hypothetical protein
MTTEAADDMLRALTTYQYSDYLLEWERCIGKDKLEGFRTIVVGGQERQVRVYRLSIRGFYNHVAELMSLLHQYAESSANDEAQAAQAAWRLTAIYEYALLF